jgi:hypothetical protein
MGPVLDIVTSLKFKEMRVMYHPSLDCQSVPVEGCMTRRTPHLGTPAHFGNEHTATGTSFRIGLDEFHRINVRLETYMLVIAFDLITVFTNQITTNFALPP